MNNITNTFFNHLVTAIYDRNSVSSRGFMQELWRHFDANEEIELNVDWNQENLLIATACVHYLSTHPKFMANIPEWAASVEPVKGGAIYNAIHEDYRDFFSEEEYSPIFLMYGIIVPKNYLEFI